MDPTMHSAAVHSDGREVGRFRATRRNRTPSAPSRQAPPPAAGGQPIAALRLPTRILPRGPASAAASGTPVLEARAPCSSRCHQAEVLAPATKVLLRPRVCWPPCPRRRCPELSLTWSSCALLARQAVNTTSVNTPLCPVLTGHKVTFLKQELPAATRLFPPRAEGRGAGTFPACLSSGRARGPQRTLTQTALGKSHVRRRGSARPEPGGGLEDPTEAAPGAGPGRSEAPHPPGPLELPFRPPRPRPEPFSRAQP